MRSGKFMLGNAFRVFLASLILLFSYASLAAVGIEEPGMTAGTSPGSRQAVPVLSRNSSRQVYKVTLSPETSGNKLGVMHSWRITTATATGEPFIPGQLFVNGGMPSHGHGLPSKPSVTQYLGADGFRLTGVKFNMTGAWQLVVSLTGPSGLDQAVFDFTVDALGSIADIPIQSTDSVSKTLAASKPQKTPLSERDGFSAAQQAMIASLHIDQLPPVTDPGNRLLGDPRAQALGEQLFFDTTLSSDNKRSCASCHQPDKGFGDGLRLGQGNVELKRHTPSLLGVAHQQWYYWDGRRDSLWAQALTPLETAEEMGNNRGDVVRSVLKNYGKRFTPLLPEAVRKIRRKDIPVGAGPYSSKEGKQRWHKLKETTKDQINEAFATVGMAIAAYEATLVHKASRFDRYASALSDDISAEINLLTRQEKTGLALFLDVGKTQCMQCHNGPQLTNNGFHNIGTGPDSAGNSFDYGRAIGLQAAMFNPFNCLNRLGRDQEACMHVQFANSSSLPPTAQGAFKVPSLRNLSKTSPYTHDGRFSTLQEVLAFYQDPPSVEQVPHELRTLALADEEQAALIAFLLTLNDAD